MQKVENLYALYRLGHFLGQLSHILEIPEVTFSAIELRCAAGREDLSNIIDGDPLPFETGPFENTKSAMVVLMSAIDSLVHKCDIDPDKLTLPISGTEEAVVMKRAIVALEHHLSRDLNAMPIWLVTVRRAYSIDALINKAETVLDSDSISLLSDRSIRDIRDAGKAIAFDLPTAAGFHSFRAVEGIARSYHKVIIGTRPADKDEFGTVIGRLDEKKKSLTLDKDDLLPLAIETLYRLKHIRNGLAHPDKFLNSRSAMNVFDSAKCAIQLMLEDAQRKSPDEPKGSF